MGKRWRSEQRDRKYHAWFFAIASVALLLGSEPAAGEIRTCERIFETNGPSFKLILPGAKVDPAQGRAKLKYLRLAQYSLRQFDIHHDQSEHVADKVAHAIFAEKPDVLFLSEVKNIESLHEIARLAGNLFEPILIQGNDGSLLDIGVLIRKSLPLEALIESHRAWTHQWFGVQVPLFTRDLVLLTLTTPGEPRPLLIIGDSHFKADEISRVEKPGRSYTDKREAQETGALTILEKKRIEKSPRGLVMMGDLNADVRRSTEFVHLKTAGFQESLDVLGIPMDRRVTHTGFGFNGVDPRNRQPDAIFLSREIVSTNALVSGYVVPDRTIMGAKLERAKNFKDRNERTSDHKMVIVEIDVTKLR